ncbi:MAG: SEL1-like repeat protein [Phycisphaerales bacterium]|nr:SEL1-like repeat protein [Phycisphaerales bacterium]
MLFTIETLLERAAAPGIAHERKARYLESAWEYLQPMACDPLLDDSAAWALLGRFALEVGETGPVADRELAGAAAEALRRLGSNEEQLRVAGRLEVLAGRGVSDRVRRLREQHMATFTAAADGDPEASLKLAALFDPEQTDWAQSPVARHPVGVVHWLEKAAETGHTEAMNRLAVRLLGGWGVPADHRRAVELAENAWDTSGDLWSRSLMAWAYVNQLGIDETKDRATYAARLARAEAGDLRAMSGVGVMLMYGRGVRENEVEAVRWFRKAADEGDAEGQAGLGWMYALGVGVLKDETEAAKWFRKAAEQGFAVAQNALGWMYENGHGVHRDEAEAARWYRKSAEQGYSVAQRSLGLMYAYGRGGLPRDQSEAVRWYRKAAEQGLMVAQSSLGSMYGLGRGVSKDEAVAVRWYLKAALQGDSEAQFRVGSMYMYAMGVSEDSAEAAKWYRKAAQQGHAEAQYMLGFMYRLGRGVAINDAEAVRLMRMAAERGYAPAQRDLGLIYATGEVGLPKDPTVAIRWLRLAAAQGDSEAQYILGVIYEYGRGVARDEDEAKRWWRLAARQGHHEARQQLQERGESW